MRQKITGLGIGLVLLLGVIFVWQSLSPDTTQAEKTSLIGEEYELPALGFAKVEGDYKWAFPADFAPHSDYQREEWEIATNSACAYELTLSLRSLNILPDVLTIERESDWAFNQVLTGELRLMKDDNLILAEVVDSRVAQDLAGVTADRVWLESWVFDRTAETFTITGAELSADFTLTLTNPEPLPSAEVWYAYQQSGTLAGNLVVSDETYTLDCAIEFTQRFGSAS